MSKKFETELPEDYAELKKEANYTSSWRDRLDAVNQLSKYNHPKVIDLLTNRMENDTVYKVQDAAYRALTAFGEDVQPPKRQKFDIIKGTDKILIRVKKSLPADHAFEEFAEKLKRMRIDVYDAYEGHKGDEFKAWLEEKWASLQVNKTSK